LAYLYTSDGLATLISEMSKIQSMSFPIATPDIKGC